MSESRKKYVVTHYEEICLRNKIMMNEEVKNKIGKSNSITKNLPENTIKYSKIQSDRWKDPEYREIQHSTRKTEEYKSLMSSTMKGKTKGYVSILKDGENKRVPKEEIQSYLDKGWVVGESLRTPIPDIEPTITEDLIIPKNTPLEKLESYKKNNASRIVWCPELDIYFRSMKCAMISFHLPSDSILKQIIDKNLMINNKYHLCFLNLKKEEDSHYTVTILK